MDRAAEETGVRYLFGARDDTGVDGDGDGGGGVDGEEEEEREKEREEERERKRPDMPSGENYENVGQRPREEFVRELARSRVLIGVGNPLMCVSSSSFVFFSVSRFFGFSIFLFFRAVRVRAGLEEGLC